MPALNAVQQKTISAILQIFETGRYTSVSYGAVANIKGDTGSVSFGQHQASLTSGNLYLLLKRYDDAKGAYSKDLAKFLPKVKAKDRSLEKATDFINLLKQSGTDPVMQIVQDQFFYDQFMAPAINAGLKYGFTQPLSFAVIYDSFIHGSWGAMRDRTLKVARTSDEKAWIKEYLSQRKSWLKTKSKLLAKTVYRPEAFEALIKANNWALTLPFVCKGVKLTPAMLQIQNAVEAPVAVIPEEDMIKANEFSVLMIEDDLRKPTNDRDDVEAVQKALLDAGYYKGKVDGLFGPMLEKSVEAFQKAKGLSADGIVGNQTLSALNLV